MSTKSTKSAPAKSSRGPKDAGGRPGVMLSREEDAERRRAAKARKPKGRTVLARDKHVGVMQRARQLTYLADQERKLRKAVALDAIDNHPAIQQLLARQGSEAEAKKGAVIELINNWVVGPPYDQMSVSIREIRSSDHGVGKLVRRVLLESLRVVRAAEPISA